MKISFHGAAQGVTGSCHLLEVAGKKLLVDCGLFQGGRELDEENLAPFGFDPTKIDFVLLTHAHLDHCGRLPLLVKQGFVGEVIATSATRELTRIIILDSAGLNEQEAEWKNRKLLRKGHTDSLVALLYSTEVPCIHWITLAVLPVMINRLELQKGYALPLSMPVIFLGRRVLLLSWKKMVNNLVSYFLAIWAVKGTLLFATRANHRR